MAVQHLPEDATVRRNALRRELRARRDALSDDHRASAELAIAERLTTAPSLSGARAIAAYAAIGSEPSLAPAIARLSERGASIHLPRIDTGSRSMAFLLCQADATLAANAYGIAEVADPAAPVRAPAALDAVLLPLIGFDRHGNRLGSGGGYYDRAFAFRRRHDARVPPLLIGVGFACQELAAIEPGPWDVPLDAIATESEWIECAAPADARR